MTEFEQICVQQVNREFYLNLAILIIAVVSAILFYIDYKYRKSKEKAEKSIQLAEVFANKIIRPLSIIGVFLEEKGIADIIKNKKLIELELFDINEMKSLYSEQDIKKVDAILNESKEKKDQAMLLLINTTLNYLEAMCMYISSNVANDKYIYPSLHQVLLGSVQTLYFNIAMLNTDVKDKYYCHLITVFNKWKNKYIKECEKEREYIKKHSSGLPRI